MAHKLYFEAFCQTKEEVHIGDLLLSEGEHTIAHQHDFFEVFIVLEGTFTHLWNGKSVQMNKGMGQFIKPSDCHYFKACHQSKRNVLRNIAIHPMIFKKLINRSKYPVGQSFFKDFEVDEHLLYQFKYKTEKLIEEMDQDYRMYLTESILSDLVIFVCDDYQRLKSVPKWLQYVCEEMQKIENRIIGLPKLLELSARSQEHVTRTFTQYYNQSPTDYINELRLKESARLLVQTDWLIIVIAEKCGFSTLTYYNKLFKKYYGYAPSEYRRKHKKSLF